MLSRQVKGMYDAHLSNLPFAQRDSRSKSQFGQGSFKAKFKLKIWVNLENLSIVAWNNELFIAIVSRWGKVIKIEEDTSFRNQFDCARILNGVKSISDEATRVVPNTTTNTACLEGGVPGEMKHCDRPNPKLGAGQVGLREVESDPNNQSKEFQNSYKARIVLEVAASFEVYDRIKLKFDASREEVLSRFERLEVESGL
ncbi:hypothetical protein V6N11_072180 [Hibiscus sabdariffa]|uniref:Uncharacterized protein n=1 Tax=Hibiscus sabdariffa TaxID=183260 RepID=A0ABR2U2P2_9ROSI